MSTIDRPETAGFPTDDAFEADVRTAFRRHGASLDPLVAQVRVPEPAPVVLMPVRLAPRPRLLPVLAAAVLVVAFLGAVLVGPGLVRRSAASPSMPASPLPAQWTALDWAHATTDGKPVNEGNLNAAWNGAWVLASTSGLSFSTDGQAWIRTQSFSGALFALVAPAPHGFVVAETYLSGEDGSIHVNSWYSTDGRTWSRNDATAFGGQNQIWDVASGPRGLVAVGLTAPDSVNIGMQSDFAAWFSPDGVYWQRIAVDPAVFGHGVPFSVAATGAGFLIGGSSDGSSAIWSSPDGRAWNRTGFAGTPGREVTVLAAGARGVVAGDAPNAGSSAPESRGPRRFWRSVDGQSWVPAAPGATFDYVSGDGLRAVGWSGATSPPQHSVSFDGRSWAAVLDERHASWLGFSHDAVLAQANDTLYVVPVITATGPSPEPTPAPTPSPSATLQTPAIDWTEGSVSVVAGPRGWFAYGSTQTSTPEQRPAWYSRDGSSWRRLQEDELDLTNSYILDVAAGPDGFLAVGRGIEDLGGSMRIWRSTDGQAWTKLDASPLLATPITSIAAGPGGYLAFGAEPTVRPRAWLSADGASWHEISEAFPEDTTELGLASSVRGYLVVLAPAGGNENLIAGFSADGVSWSFTPLEPFCCGRKRDGQAIAADGMIVVTRGGQGGDGPTVWWSADGRNWTQRNAWSGDLLDRIVGDGSTMYVTTSLHQLLRSSDGATWQRASIASRPIPPVPNGSLAATNGGSLAWVADGVGLVFVPASAVEAGPARPVESPSPGATPAISTPMPSPTPPPSPLAGEWTRLTWPAAFASETRFNLVAAGPKGFVGVIQQPAAATTGIWIEYSRDGRSFTKADTSDQTLAHADIRWLVASPQGFLAVGERDRSPNGVGRETIWTSADGSKWTAAPTGTLFDGCRITVGWARDGYLAVGSDASERPGIWTSADGRSWRREPLDPTAFAGARLSGSGYSDSTGWLIGGAVSSGTEIGGAVWRSNDGRTWRRDPVLPGTAGTLVSGFRITARALVATGSRDTRTDTPSDANDTWRWDGTAWSGPGYDGMFWEIMSDGTRFVRSDGLRIEASLDGLTWRRVAVSDHGYVMLNALTPSGVLVTTADDRVWFLTASTN